LSQWIDALPEEKQEIVVELIEKGFALMKKFKKTYGKDIREMKQNQKMNHSQKMSEEMIKEIEDFDNIKAKLLTADTESLKRFVGENIW